MTSDVLCLAMAIYLESGNQPLLDKLGVAQVTLNRVGTKAIYPGYKSAYRRTRVVALGMTL